MSGSVKRGSLASRIGGCAAVIIVQADDVILAEVITVLDLNEHQRTVAGVLNPVGCTKRDIDGISSPNIDAAAV
jgi:hypothetical protein